MTLLVRLRFRAPLHIGSSTLGEEDTHDYAPSDTLFSALCHAYLAAFGEEELVSLLGRFDENPPFLISSAFPYYQENLLLPRPRVEPGERDGEPETGDGKLLKETSWVPLEAFAAMLRGESPNLPEDLPSWLPQKELLPRVALDRESSGSSIYYVRRTVFPEGGSLWALLDLRDGSLEPCLRQAFHLLGEMGLGGERTMGCGFFEPRFEEPPPKLARHLDGDKPYVALSRVRPEGPEIRDADLYELVESRGWMLSPTGAQRKRRSAWLLAEGSSFTGRARGRLLDVTPDDSPGHPVYRYGYGMYAGRV